RSTNFRLHVPLREDILYTCPHCLIWRPIWRGEPMKTASLPIVEGPPAEGASLDFHGRILSYHFAGSAPWSPVVFATRSSVFCMTDKPVLSSLFFRPLSEPWQFIFTLSWPMARNFSGFSGSRHRFRDFSWQLLDSCALLGNHVRSWLPVPEIP